jgi:hypothetical protein
MPKHGRKSSKDEPRAKKPRPPKRGKKPKDIKEGISNDELIEFEDFARRHEADTSPYHVQQSLQAATVLLLIELIRDGRRG